MPPIDTEEVNFMKEVVAQLATLNALVKRLDETIEAIEERNRHQLESVVAQNAADTSKLWVAMSACQKDMSAIQVANAGVEAVGKYKMWMGRVLAGVLALAVGSVGTFVRVHDREISQIQTEVKWIEKRLDE
jgi:hypothetical protein